MEISEVVGGQGRIETAREGQALDGHGRAEPVAIGVVGRSRILVAADSQFNLIAVVSLDGRLEHVAGLITLNAPVRPCLQELVKRACPAPYSALSGP